MTSSSSLLALFGTLGVVWLTALSGCAETTALKPYVAPHFEVRADERAVVETIELFAAKRGWKIITRNEGAGLVVARSAEVTTSVGNLERETWTFVVAGGELAIQLRRESRFEGDSEWKSTDVVCGGYEYATETLLADDLRMALASDKEIAAR